MADLIDRQAAIDAINALHEKPNAWLDSAVDAVMTLPSAQPEPCEDTVSRQILLSDLKELVAAWKKYPVMAEQIKGVETAIGYVEAIPPAQPERKGKWIKLDMHAHLADHKCTACGQECYVPTCMGEPMYTYCPNCGADMRGTEND